MKMGLVLGWHVYSFSQSGKGFRSQCQRENEKGFVENWAAEPYRGRHIEQEERPAARVAPISSFRGTEFYR